MEGVMILKHLNQKLGSDDDQHYDQLLQFVNQLLLPDKTDIDDDDSPKYPEEHEN
jgi:hypothetical protein